MSRNDCPGASPTRFSFVIVSYNTLKLTRAAISSIVRYAQNFSHEIILVDNHSTDDSVPSLQREFPQLKIIAFEENRGYAAATNAGAKIAVGEWLALINSDAELFPDTMKMVDELLCRNSQVDILGGQLLNPDGSLQTSVQARRSSHFEERHQNEDMVKVTRIIGAFMVVRHELWRKLNGMDEGLFLYGEERDFFSRATNAGAAVYWSPRFRVLHHGGGSGRSLKSEIEFWTSKHYSWRKAMSEQEYRATVRRTIVQLAVRVCWYFSLALLTGFLLQAFTGRLFKYAHLLNWHLRGCPPGWGLRPKNLQNLKST